MRSPSPYRAPPVLLIPSDRPPTTGELIAYYRERKDWSQDQLGRAIGVTGQTIGKYEAGRDVKEPVILRIARALDVSVRDLRPDPEADPEERYVADWFRHARAEHRHLVLNLIQTLSAGTLHEKPPAAFEHRKPPR